jgi:UrcA family protein
MPRIVLLSLAAILSAALAQNAAAQPDYRYPLIERTVAVSYHDLDLSKPADARIMLDRINQAARRACGFRPERDKAYSIASQFVTRDFTGCMARATEQAIANVRAPLVSQMYAGAAADVRQAAH